MYEPFNETLLGDLKSLSKWNGTPGTEARARRLCDALNEASNRCGDARLQSSDSMARHELSVLGEGFAAAARIVGRFVDDARTA